MYFPKTHVAISFKLWILISDWILSHLTLGTKR